MDIDPLVSCRKEMEVLALGISIDVNTLVGCREGIRIEDRVGPLIRNTCSTWSATALGPIRGIFPITIAPYPIKVLAFRGKGE